LNRRKYRLGVQTILAVLVSAGIAVSAFLMMKTEGVTLLDRYFQKTDYEEVQNKKALDSFESYVKLHQVKATDSDAIQLWLETKKAVYFKMAVLRDGEVMFEEMFANWQSIMEEIEDDWFLHRTIEFADGTANVYTYGYFADRFYSYSTAAEFIIAALVFVVLFFLFFQRKIRYIELLEKEVKILETGGLEHPITIKGSDELTSLAEGLDQMRISLHENMQKEETAVKANHDLVVAVAHDLRTPLTALTLYLDLLQQGKYQNQEQMEEYLRKSRGKAAQIKNMSDHLFERFLLAKETAVVLGPPQSAQYVFEDILSDFANDLIENQFNVEGEMNWAEAKISVAMDYVSRIMDNISSNIMKYADKEEPVIIQTDGSQEQFAIRITNCIRRMEEKMESTEVGVVNIMILMEKMSGQCRINKTDTHYTITLLFPVQ